MQHSSNTVFATFSSAAFLWSLPVCKLSVNYCYHQLLARPLVRADAKRWNLYTTDFREGGSLVSDILNSQFIWCIQNLTESWQLWLSCQHVSLSDVCSQQLQNHVERNYRLPMVRKFVCKPVHQEVKEGSVLNFSLTCCDIMSLYFS